MGASGIALVATSNIAIPGGATNAIFNGNTMYVAGQCLAGPNFQCATPAARATVSLSGQLSDTEHPDRRGLRAHIRSATERITRWSFGDDNTLWVGSSQCQAGEHYKLNQAGGSTQYGCLTMFNTSNNSALLDSYKGDATGIAAVTGLNKVYTAEGGQVYIYNTADGSERDNSNVTVPGTAIDVAYMDATSDGDNTHY